MASYSNPSPDTHLEVLARQTFNSIGAITAAGLTQDNHAGNVQKANNARTLGAPLGILAGSVVAVAGNLSIGPCAGDSSTTFDMAVGIAVNNAVGNPYESSSAVASGKAVYAHGTGTVFNTDIYETKATDGTANLSYTAGDKLYASRNGLLTKITGLDNTNLTYSTLIGICLKAPTPGSDPYMAVQLRI
jgi:hypothetical protein